MTHAEVLHGMATSLIRSYTWEVPAGMEWVWDREHKKYFDKAARVKAKHDMFRK